MKMRFLLMASFCLMFFMSCKKELKTKDGYVYTILESGSGDAPDTTDYVFFNVKVFVQDSVSKKDSLVQEDVEGAEPVIQITTPQDPTLPNWIQEMLATAKVGAKYRMVMPMDSITFQIPPALMAYPELIYEITVKKINTKAEFDKYREAKIAEQEAKMKANLEKRDGVEELVKNTLADYKSGKLQTQKTASGLEYYMIQEGQGAKAEKGKTVSVHYFGVLQENGSHFDDSFQRGDEFSFVVGSGGVIQGWEEGVALLSKGAKVCFFIPSELAYGKAGAGNSIPPDSNLLFYIELLGVK